MSARRVDPNPTLIVYVVFVYGLTLGVLKVPFAVGLIASMGAPLVVLAVHWLFSMRRER